MADQTISHNLVSLLIFNETQHDSSIRKIYQYIWRTGFDSNVFRDHISIGFYLRTFRCICVFCSCDSLRYYQSPLVQFWQVYLVFNNSIRMESIFAESFKDHLVSNYMADCPRKIMYSQYFKLIDFLLENQIIPTKVVRIYTVMNEYTYLTEAKRFRNKTQLVRAISVKFDLHENTVWNIIKDYQNSFSP